MNGERVQLPLLNIRLVESHEIEPGSEQYDRGTVFITDSGNQDFSVLVRTHGDVDRALEQNDQEEQSGSTPDIEPSLIVPVDSFTVEELQVIVTELSPKLLGLFAVRQYDNGDAAVNEQHV